MKQTAIVVDSTKINVATEWLESQKVQFSFERDKAGEGTVTLIVPRVFTKKLLEVLHATV